MARLTRQQCFLALQYRHRRSYRSSPIQDELKEQANPVGPERCQALFLDDLKQSVVYC